MRFTFSAASLDAGLEWYCEPTEWHTADSAGGLLLVTESDTDYWQRTHYGFRRDNGHFLYAEPAGDMMLETRVHYEPMHDFDQAGLMVRFSTDEWIKTSVEMETDGSFHLGAVVTRGGYSDWSTQSYPAGPIDLKLRVRRVGDDFHVLWSPGDDDSWRQLRVTHLTPPAGAPLLAGIYAASPSTGGCRVRFEHLLLE